MAQDNIDKKLHEGLLAGLAPLRAERRATASTAFEHRYGPEFSDGLINGNTPEEQDLMDEFLGQGTATPEPKPETMQQLRDRLRRAEDLESISVKPRLRPWQQAAIDQVLKEPNALCDFVACGLPDLDAAQLTMRNRSKGPGFLFDSFPHNPFESGGAMLSPRSFDTCDAALDVPNPTAGWEEDEAAVKNVVIGHPKTHRPSKKRVKQQKKSKRANRRK